MKVYELIDNVKEFDEEVKTKLYNGFLNLDLSDLIVPVIVILGFFLYKIFSRKEDDKAEFDF